MHVTSIAMQASAVANWGLISAAIQPATATSVIGSDTSLAGGSSSSVSSKTVAMTLGANANYLLVGVVGDITVDKITGVTYNGVAMTLIAKIFPAPIEWMYLFGLANPTTGSSQNIVVSASGTCSIIGLDAQSYTNCNAIQPSVSASAAFRSIAISWTVLEPQVGGCWGFAFSRNSVGTLLSATVAGPGTVAAIRVTEALGSIVDTNGPIPVPPTVTLTPNSAQWRVQRADIGRSKDERIA